jgi:DNA polymerase
MLVAQAPGEQEDQEAALFIGPSGPIFDALLAKAGLERSSIFVTNLLKCTLPRCRRPKRKEIEACQPFLEQEISLVDPDVLVPLGFYATSSLMQRNNLTPPKGRKDSTNFFGHLFWNGHKKVYPLPHPSSLLYNPDYRPLAETLYAKLKVLSRQCQWYPLCPMKRLFEKGALNESWIQLYCTGDWSACTRFALEAKGQYHPDWMLPDGTLDTDLKTWL